MNSEELCLPEAPLTSRPPFWILMVVAILSFHGVTSLLTGLLNPLIQSKVTLAFGWPRILSGSIALLLCYGLVKGKNWVRILTIVRGCLSIVVVFLPYVVTLIFNKNTTSRIDSLEAGFPEIFTILEPAVTIGFSVLFIYGLTRESSRLWCALPRPNPFWIKHSFILMLLIGIYPAIFLLSYKRDLHNAFPVKAIFHLKNEEGTEPIDIQSFETFEIRHGFHSLRRGNLSFDFNHETRTLLIEGVAFEPSIYRLGSSNQNIEIIISDEMPSESDLFVPSP